MTAVQACNWKRYAMVLPVACLLLGAYCCELNRVHYEHHTAFYDSVSYNEKLFRVMTISRESGFLESLETACFENNTNCLPFLIGAAIAPVAAPSRSIGIWIQTGLLFLFLASLFYYLIRFRTLRPATALAVCLVFLSAKCLFFFNGGLSDFRMDFSLYLSFSLSCVWYLSCVECPRRSHFIILGIAAAIACLFRAIAPVYLLIGLGPLAIIELAKPGARAQWVTGLGISFGVVVVLSGWFYFFNFEFLKYYYTVWNTDANAEIPIGEALHHLSLLQRAVGEPLIGLIACWGAAVLYVTRRHDWANGWIITAISKREIDFSIAWIGASPVLMLIASRAGLNPFVSMPAVFGLVLFFVLPIAIQFDRLNHRVLTRFFWGSLILILVATSGRAWQRHTRLEFDSKVSHNQLIDAMVGDAGRRKVSMISYGVMHLTDLDSNILYSTLLFDRPDVIPLLTHIEFETVQLTRVAIFARPAEADWDRVQGETDEEKAAFLVAEANRRIDYLIMPDEQTAVELEETAKHNYINRQLVLMRRLVVSDPTWILFEPSIQTNLVETVQIYRKERRPDTGESESVGRR